MARKLTPSQIMAIEVSERTMSGLSIVGSLFIIATFARWPYFRKPINRLVFYASFGNMMANVATLIATSAIPKEPNGFNALCEFQGVLIQWFMMADSLWVFCMALNVKLVFFHGYDSIQLRYLEKWYLLFSYGLTGIPPIVYIILDHHGRKPVIGAATIWCWVRKDVEWMRIAFFYAPVWIAVVFTLGIYIVTGREIFKKRAVLHSVSRRTVSDEPPMINPFTAINNIKVETVMKVETHPSSSDSDSMDVPPEPDHGSRSSFSSTRNLSDPATVEAKAPITSIQTRFSRVNWNPNPQKQVQIAPTPQKDDGRNGYRATAFATYNASSVEVSARPSGSRRGMEKNAAAWSYFKVAFLMFAALFIVWVPSTVNRLVQFIHKDAPPSFGLNLASALVLPLQGFWNAMIYMSTTWPECKRAFTETMYTVTGREKYQPRPDFYRKDSQHTTSTDEAQESDMEIQMN